MTTRFIPAESIPAEVRERANSALALAGLTAPLSAVLVGAAAWDIRPVIEAKDTRQLLRISDPGLVPGSEGYLALRSILLNLAQNEDLLPGVSAGEGERRLWILRPFAELTLEDALDPFSAAPFIARKDQVLDLVRIMARAHSAGIVHGHLTVRNVILAAGKFLPVDHGFFGVQQHQAAPSVFQDILDLGKLAGTLIGTILEPYESKIIERMIDPQAGRRPALSEVIRLFEEGSPPQPNAPRIVPSGARSAVASGKVLSGAVTAPPIPEPAQDPVVPAAAPVGEKREPAPLNAVHVPPGEAPTPDPVSDTSSVTDPEHQPPLEVASPVAERRQPHWYLPAAVIVLLLFGVLLRDRLVGNSAIPTEELQALWESGDPGQMREVVHSALESPSSPATDIIVSDTRKGRRLPFIRTDIMALGFHPIWQKQLSDDDKRALLTLSLGDLIDTDDQKFPGLSTLHPGITLALAATIPLDRQGSMFGQVPITRMGQLPSPYGEPFQLLEQLGVMSAAEPAARALAHLTVGDANVPLVEAYFAKPNDKKAVDAQVRLLAPFIRLFPSIADPLMTYLQGLSGDFAAMIDWFNEKQTVDWQNVSRLDRLWIMTGTLGGLQLSLEQYIDLLQFPQEQTRNAAKDYLGQKYFSRAHRGMLVVLASDENRLSRSQSVLLVTALHLPEEQSFAFFGKWFEGDPDPQTIFLLLLSRSKAPRSSPFDVEAARYLINCRCQWDSSTEELKLLVQHTEVLARALAYARLDPADPAQQAILRARVKSETNQRMREQVVKKLEMVR